MAESTTGRKTPQDRLSPLPRDVWRRFVTSVGPIVSTRVDGDQPTQALPLESATLPLRSGNLTNR